MAPGDSTDEEQLSPDETVELLDDIRSEARETLDQQISTLDDIDTKSSRILRLNVLIISAILAVFSFSARADVLSPTDFLNPYVVLGTTCLVLSTAFAALTYTASDLEIGIAYEDIRTVLEEDYPIEEYLEELVYGYASWIEFNDRTNIRNAPLITTTVLLVIYGITFLSLGVAEAVGDTTLHLAIPGGVALVLSLLTYASGIVGQLRRWYGERIG